MGIEDMASDDMPLFDLAEGRVRRDEGITRAIRPDDRQRWMEEARAVARRIARERGRVTADDVVRWHVERGTDLTARLGPALGGLFRGAEWEWTGQFMQSAQVRNHARLQRVWRLAR